MKFMMTTVATDRLIDATTTRCVIQLYLINISRNYNCQQFSDVKVSYDFCHVAAAANQNSSVIHSVSRISNFVI